MTQYKTPVYQLPYCDANEPVKNWPALQQGVAERIEKAFGDAQIPPGNPSQNDVLVRLANLETPIGIKAGIGTNAMTITEGNTPTSGKIIPFTVRPAGSNPGGDYSKGGMTIAGGVVTVPKAGIYSISAGAGTGGAINGRGVKIYLEVNGAYVAASETGMYNGTTWVNCTLALPLYLSAGDKVGVRVFLTGAMTGATLPNSGETSYLALARTGPQA